MGLLRRGSRVLTATLLGGIAAGALLAFAVVPSQWQSEALLVHDAPPDASSPWTEQNALNEGAELLMHPSTLRRVRERIGHEGTVESLAKRLRAEADRNADVVRVTATAPARDEAVALAQAAVDTFLEVRRQSERARLTERARQRRIELAAAQAHLAEARAEYDAFRAEHAVSDLDAQQESAIAELARLTSEAAQEEVTALSAAARMEVLRREARRLPAMTTASASSTDLVEAELAAARAELTQASGRYTDDHPTVMGLRARVEALSRERRRGTKALRTDATSSSNPVRETLEGNAALAAADRATSVRRREGLERLAEQARERVRTLTALEGQASLLVAAVRIGEEQVEALRRDIAQSEDRLREPPAGFHVAAPASVPDSPMRSRGRRLVMVLPPAIALLVAFGFLFWRERGGARPHTPVEVAWWGHAPVIGTTTWPRDRNALDLLIAELEDLGTYAAGRTLVVPATGRERELATKFAAKLAEAPWLAARVLEVGEVAHAAGGRKQLLQENVRRASRRPTLPVPMMITPVPTPESGTALSAAEAEAAAGDGTDTRKVTGRFMLSAPTVRVGPDVRVGNIVRVGEEPAAAVWSRAPVEAETRTIRVSGMVDDGRGAPAPFEVRADAPVEQDAVLMLAMRILGDVDPEASRPTTVEPRTARHHVGNAREPRAPSEPAVALAWTGALEGPTLRRAARLADRVIVLVREGTLSPADLVTLQTRLGREDAIGLLVVGASESSVRGPDRVGPVAEFWTARHRLPE